MARKGMGKGQGMGYKNIVPRDPYIHGLSAKGVKTYAKLTKKQKKAIGKGLGTAIGLVAGAQATRGTGYEGIGAIAGGYAGYKIGGSLFAKGKADYVPKKTPRYEYVWGGDVFDDDNEGLLYGVEDVSDFPAYVEWFSSWEEREKNSKAGKMNIVNREQHYDYLKRKKILDAKSRDWMRTVIKFEDQNPEYPSSQMSGIASEIERKYQHEPYINEKIENTKRFYSGTLDNFGHRIKNKEIQKEFKRKLKSGKLDAKFYETSKRNTKTGKVDTVVSLGKNPDFKKGKKFTKGMGRFKKEYEYLEHKPIKKELPKKLAKSWGWLDAKGKKWEWGGVNSFGQFRKVIYNRSDHKKFVTLETDVTDREIEVQVGNKMFKHDYTGMYEIENPKTVFRGTSKVKAMAVAKKFMK